MERQTTIRELKGIGDKTAALFARLNIYTIDDLLLHYPVGYDRFLPEVAVNQLEEGQVCAFRGQLQGSIAGRKTRTLTVSTCRVSDTTGEVSLTFFNIPYLKNMIKPGEPYIFRDWYRESLQVGKWNSPRCILWRRMGSFWIHFSPGIP